MHAIPADKFLSSSRSFKKYFSTAKQEKKNDYNFGYTFFNKFLQKLMISLGILMFY